MRYDLEFDIAPELYRRAVTQPIDGAPSQRRVMIGNLAAAALFPASIFAFNRALFSPESLVPMLFAAAVGAGLVLAVWWRRHRALVEIHSRFNDSGGRQCFGLSAEGVVVSRPLIESRMDWAFVRRIWSIEGATLIEPPTARLIVPDVALPEGVSQSDFIAQLGAWRAA